MGAYAFGLPRELRIEWSDDGDAWSVAWQGPTAIPAVRAALTDPAQVPLTLPFDPVSARYVRLTQVGQEPDLPWWIAELQVMAPAR